MAALQGLYAVPPDEFTAARGRLVADARTAGDKDGAEEIKALRRPTVSAWAVNALVRARADLAERVAGTGARLRAAQSRLDVEALASLRPERDALLDEVVTAATTVAGESGRELAQAARQEVRDTVIAALASEAACAAALSGHLTRALSYSGFGEVDLSSAVALTGGGTVLAVVRGGRGGDDRGTRPEPERKARGTRPSRDVEAKPRQQTAEREAAEREEAERVRRAEARERARLERERARAAEALDKAERRLHDAEQHVRDVEAAIATARQAREAARTAYEKAKQALDVSR